MSRIFNLVQRTLNDVVEPPRVILHEFVTVLWYSVVALTQSFRLSTSAFLPIMDSSVVVLVDLAYELNATVKQLSSVATLSSARLSVTSRDLASSFADAGWTLASSFVVAAQDLQRIVLWFLQLPGKAMAPMRSRRSPVHASSETASSLASSARENRGHAGKLTPLQAALIILFLDLLLRYPANKLWDYFWNKLFP